MQRSVTVAVAVLEGQVQEEVGEERTQEEPEEA